MHVISDAGPHPYFRTLIEHSSEDRRRLVVGCVGPAGHLQADMEELGVATFALGARVRAEYPMAVMRLARLLRRRHAQIVQTHLIDGSVVGLMAARVARTPVAIMTAHHSHELPYHGRRLLWPERACTGAISDHIIAPSRNVADTLVRLAAVPESKISIVHHGFDFDRFDPSEVDGARVRAELGLEDKVVFGAIGRHYWLKNYAALVEAFATTMRGRPEARLVIVGPGDSEPLRALSRSLEIEDRVVLCGSRDDIPAVLAAFDVFVHPAIAESFGMVIIEAMTMARPVLSTPVGIAPDVIESTRTGFLADSPDPRALAAGLAQTLEHRSNWQTIGTAARRQVKGFTAQAMAAQHEQLYGQWLENAAHEHPRRSHADVAPPMGFRARAPTILIRAARRPDRRDEGVD